MRYQYQMGGVFENIIERTLDAAKGVIEDQKKEDKAKNQPKDQTEKQPGPPSGYPAAVNAQPKVGMDMPTWAWVLLAYIVIKGLK